MSEQQQLNGSSSEKLKVVRSLDLLTIVGKSVINKWAHERDMNVGAEVFPSINQFVLALDWRSVLQFSAPAATPDVGIVASRFNAMVSQNLQGAVEVKDSKRAQTNLSFLLWTSLNATAEILASIKRKRLSFDILFPVLLATYNNALAAIGAPPTVIEVQVEVKKREKKEKVTEAQSEGASEAASEAKDEGEAVSASAIGEPPAKKKKTGSKNIPLTSTVSIEDPMAVPTNNE